jgi:hypothetical protein
MTIQTIPLTPVASQTFTVLLGNQNCKINIYQLSTGLFFDLNVGGNDIVNSMICLNLVGLVRETYLGFKGQLAFVDTKGNDDPVYTGLGSRFQLVYTS